jgi:hypothetical protein
MHPATSGRGPDGRQTGGVGAASSRWTRTSSAAVPGHIAPQYGWRSPTGHAGRVDPLHPCPLARCRASALLDLLR